MGCVPMTIKEKIQKSVGVVSETLLKRFNLSILMQISERLESESFIVFSNRRAAMMLPNILKKKLKDQETNV